MAKQFLERLAIEHKETCIRLERLLHFLSTYQPNDITKEERDLMISQIGTMYTYLNILERRLKLHDVRIESGKDDGVPYWHYICGDGERIGVAAHE